MNRKIGENRKITLNDIMKSSLLMFVEKKTILEWKTRKPKNFGKALQENDSPLLDLH